MACFARSRWRVGSPWYECSSKSGGRGGRYEVTLYIQAWLVSGIDMCFDRRRFGFLVITWLLYSCRWTPVGIGGGRLALPSVWRHGDLGPVWDCQNLAAGNLHTLVAKMPLGRRLKKHLSHLIAYPSCTYIGPYRSLLHVDPHVLCLRSYLARVDLASLVCAGTVLLL